MYERFSDMSRRVLRIADHEARRLNHEYLGTEHMLLGLLHDKATGGAAILSKLGLDFRKVRLEVEKRLQRGQSDCVVMGNLPMTPRAKKVIELANQASHGYLSVNTSHLLLALIRERDGLAAQVLESLDVTEKRFHEIEGSVCQPVTDETQLKLEKLYELKEEAVRNQDFELATKYRDEADALKAEKSKVEVSTEHHAQEALRQISCILLLHMTGNQSARDTLGQIKTVTEGV